jgi:predicted ArsR family transcriptional regulator
MIGLNALRKTGNIEVLVTLNDDENLTVDELATVTGLHPSTVRKRMALLEDEDLVQTHAEMKDGQAIVTWDITEPNGREVANKLEELVSDFTAGEMSPAAQPDEAQEEEASSD